MTAAPNPMKVAIYMPYLRPGSMSWTIYQDFAAAMGNAGAAFIVLTDDPGTGDTSPPGTVFLPSPSKAVALLDRLARPITRTSELLQRAARIRTWLGSNADVSVLYMEMTYPLGAAAWLARLFSGWRGALVMTPMGEDFLVLEEAAYGHRRHPGPRFLIARAMRAAAAVRCISPMVEPYAALFDAPAQTIPLNVANATVAAGRHAPPDRHAARRQLAADPRHNKQRLGGRGLVLSLGRLHPFKGIHVLVEAMTELPDVDLVIAGPAMTVAGYGDYGNFLAEQAQRLGVDDQVHLLGSVPHDEVITLMAAADVVVVPSILESMNRVCAEAAASGTPFIVTSTTGAADLVTEPGVGQIVAPHDPGAIAAAVRAVLHGDWKRDAAAAQRFVEQFEASRVAPQLVELIRRATTSG
jgi:glycosyltransferase involved in cell wall biosynthesis